MGECCCKSLKKTNPSAAKIVPLSNYDQSAISFKKIGECDSKPVKEINPGPAKGVPLSNYNESAKSVCKITFKQTNQTATGFFFYDSYKNRFLITNHHVISPETIRLNPNITIEIYDRKTFDLNLSSNQINIQFFSTLDITLISINNINELCDKVKF